MLGMFLGRSSQMAYRSGGSFGDAHGVVLGVLGVVGMFLGRSWVFLYLLFPISLGALWQLQLLV